MKRPKDHENHNPPAPDEPEERDLESPAEEVQEPAVQDDQALQLLRDERDQLYQRLVRAQADFQNSRRRLESDKEQAVVYANTSLIKSLLPVIDNFERALAVSSDKATVESILKGMQIVHDQWLAVLQQQEVRTIAPELGTVFDPTCHQALLQQEDSRYDQPTITQLLQKGYAFQGRVLRPAQVAVSKHD